MIYPPPNSYIDRVIATALREDLGDVGDVTSNALFGSDVQVEATVIARQDMVVCGLPIALRMVETVTEGKIEATSVVSDTDSVHAGAELMTMRGGARELLSIERLMLNFIGRLSGIATQSARYVAAVQGYEAVIVPTRKTTPGLRALEVYAVRCGGGQRHRYSLADAVLIKDNHLAAFGGDIRKAVQRARSAAGHMAIVSVEVDSLDQFNDALETNAQVILLDNFSPSEVSVAISRHAAVQSTAVLEVSGGINLDNITQYAATGISVISVGRLTHSVECADVSLDVAFSKI